MSENKTIARLKKLNEPAFICQHLLVNRHLNLNFPYSIEDNEAWCDECNKVLLEEGEWTEKALKFANITPYCTFCFAELRRNHIEMHSKQP
ncbi:MAG: hypothetical protein US89_C0005G0023 [Candidatus Peregrinibacteria bacterium GW2011_GWF2_38_29]|nr:MAG: hypothetical protein US89_C0005G0023 [Candidatus Peregrinibacteria bacterium GW2011_GWF2_38_29]HBB02612.1 hypothetical protein [Candidatus Peregrinibacteria bacterium]